MEQPLPITQTCSAASPILPSGMPALFCRNLPNLRCTRPTYVGLKKSIHSQTFLSTLPQMPSQPTLGFVPITIGTMTSCRLGSCWHKPDCSKLTGGDVFQLPVLHLPMCLRMTPRDGEGPLEVLKALLELQCPKSPPPGILSDLIFLYHLSKWTIVCCLHEF